MRQAAVRPQRLNGSSPERPDHFRMGPAPDRIRPGRAAPRRRRCNQRTRIDRRPSVGRRATRAPARAYSRRCHLAALLAARSRGALEGVSELRPWRLALPVDRWAVARRLSVPLRRGPQSHREQALGAPQPPALGAIVARTVTACSRHDCGVDYPTAFTNPRAGGLSARQSMGAM
jgi:hypothetical protein